MSATALLPFVQRCFTRYGMTTYLIVGSIGLIFNIIFFSQPAYRKSSCSLYILTMSVCGLLGLLISTVPIIYALDKPDPLTYNLFYCEMQFYLRHAFNQLMRTFFVIACADRFASCSNRANIRALSRYEVALRVILWVLLFWLIVAIFPTMLRTLNNGVCDARSGAFDIIYTVYILIALGIFPLVSFAIFGVLMTKNLKQLRNRVQPTGATLEIGGNNLRKRDRDMIKMLLIELILYTIATIPNTVMHIYKSAATGIPKSQQRQQIETFAIYVARTFLLYLNNTFSFWVYVSVSRSYRAELKILIIKGCRFIIGK